MCIVEVTKFKRYRGERKGKKEVKSISFIGSLFKGHLSCRCPECISRWMRHCLVRFLSRMLSRGKDFSLLERVLGTKQGKSKRKGTRNDGEEEKEARRRNAFVSSVGKSV